MKKTLLFIFFASFLLVDLFSTAKIVEAAYIGVTWNNPAPYNKTTNPRVYERGDVLTLKGAATATGCSNPVVNLIVNLYIETTDGSLTEIDLNGFTVISVAGVATWTGTATLPSNTKIGLPILELRYWSEEWGGVMSNQKSIDHKIRVSTPPTAPNVNLAYCTSTLTCVVTNPSTTNDPYNFCRDPLYYSIDHSSPAVFYTYKWYKCINNCTNSSSWILQNSYTHNDTIGSGPTYSQPITPTLTSGNKWKCEVTPVSRAGLLTKAIWPTEQTTGTDLYATDWTRMQGSTGTSTTTVP